MSYQVIARKWRPQTFSEVVYQDHISTTIRNSIKGGRISHAFLFSGPRGVGKTTMARIVAKSLNCAEGPTETPCGKCDNCLEIRDGHSFDVIEIDGASNRGIENIRELRENVAFAPLKSRYKIYIIDEVHMLTKEAFNALLKTLEEPPPHVVFIFATTEMHQVPETILSRCQKFFFKKMSVEAIVAHLRHISGQEGFNVDETALFAIARAAEGSMRDAQSLLDQVVSFSPGHISEESALAILGVVPMESYLNILRYAAHAQPEDAIREIDRIMGLGADVPRYAAGLSETIRDLRLIRSGIDLQHILGLSAEETASLRDAAALFNDEELGVFFRITSDLQRELRLSSNERILVEMAVLDLIAAKSRPSLASILGALESMGAPRSREPEPPAPATRPAPKAGTVPAERTAGAEKKKPLTTPATAPTADEKAPSGPLTPRDADRLWVTLMKGLKDKKPFLYMKLAEAKPAFSGDVLNILYPDDIDGSSFSRMLDSEDLSCIKDEIGRLTGREIAVAAPPRRRRASHPEEGVGDNPPPGDAVMLEQGKTADAEPANPMVDKIIELFHGQLIEDKGDK